MIFGIGTDIIDINRIKHLNISLDKLANRICTDSEIIEYNNTNNKAGYLAKKWASKEAISKAWGTGIRSHTTFKNIEIKHNHLGKPFVCFYNKLNDTANELNVKCHISISDSDNTIIAYSIIEID
jgi:holo-[acyl-carrier protein] synthase